MKRHTSWGLTLLCAMACLTGCGQDTTNGDIPPGPTVIEDLELSEELPLTGLTEPVEAVRDSRGIYHIYAANQLDLMRVQGYLMARDRMGQMEFLRRGVEGRLSEVAGTLDPSLVEGDKYVRVLGLHRQAKALYATLEDDHPFKMALDAFAEGVTAHIEEIRSGEATLPGVLPSLLKPEILEDWSGIDSLTLARYQTYSLSFDAYAEIDLTEAATGMAEAFPTDDKGATGKPGLLHDLWSFKPAAEAFTAEGFYAKSRRGESHPDLPSPTGLAGPEQLQVAKNFFLSHRYLDGLLPGPDRGSNNWVVHGSKTASGNPLLANDPHLSLPNPPVFWQAHLNTARAGGEWDTMGLVFAGTPVVVLGFNRNVAWGETVTNYDVTDVYHETIIPADKDDEADAVLFNGEPVALETIREEIKLNFGDPVILDLEVVPHHGPIIPESRTETSGLSFRWTGLETTNEALAFWKLGTAKNVDDAFEAVKHFEVGSQNFVFATSGGDIAWSTHAYIPTRDERALTYDPKSQTGYSPAMVLPGTGEYEWTGRLPEDQIPWDMNPECGWIATANQDGVGNTRDGNPFNDEVYLGWNLDLGHRMARISERLTELAERGGITPQDMSELQGDHRSPLGALMAPALVAALDRAEAEADNPGSQPDLTDAVAAADSADLARVFEMRDRLAAWTSYLTPAGIDDDPDARDLDDSVAATIFNVILTRLTNLAFGDEAELIGVRPPDQKVAKVMQWALLEPETLVSHANAIGDSWLWDDQTTGDVEETRDERVLQAALLALDFLEEELGSDMDGWLWGKLHTIRFKTQIPVDMMGQSFDDFSIPPPMDETYPDGFPRHGDNFVVDACNFSIWNGEKFNYTHGPTQRLVVEMTPDGPVAYNALPGGQQHAGDAPHHADEAEYWRRNQAPRLFYEEIDVVQNAEERVRFIP